MLASAVLSSEIIKNLYDCISLIFYENNIIKNLPKTASKLLKRVRRLSPVFVDAANSV